MSFLGLFGTLFSWLPGCSVSILDGPIGSKLKKYPANRTASEVVRLPPEPWDKAHVNISVSSTPGGGRGGSDHWYVVSTLVLERGKDRDLFPLAQVEPASVDDASARAEDKWQLAALGNGEALWASSRFYPGIYIALDVGPAPLMCYHAKTPPASSHELLLDILHAPAKIHTAATKVSADETRVVAKVVLGHAQDDEVQTAFAKLLTAKDSRLELSNLLDPAGIRTLGRIVADRPLAQNIYRQILEQSDGSHSEPRQTAVELLRESANESVQQLLAHEYARARKAYASESGYNGYYQRHLLQSLSVINETRRTAPPETVKILLEALDEPCHSPLAELFLVRAAAALPDRNLHNKLAALAKECGEATTLGWPKSFEILENSTGTESSLKEPLAFASIDCIARAALSASRTPAK